MPSFVCKSWAQAQEIPIILEFQFLEFFESSSLVFKLHSVVLTQASLNTLQQAATVRELCPSLFPLSLPLPLDKQFPNEAIWICYYEKLSFVLVWAVRMEKGLRRQKGNMDSDLLIKPCVPMV